MTIKDNQDYTEKAIARLPNQFIDSSNLISLVTLNSDRMQGINDEAIKMLDGMSLSTASGKQLDNTATILNLVRISGESDDDFRARIFAETSVLARSGEPGHVIDVYLLLTEASSIFFNENYPAGIQLAAHILSDAQDADTDNAIINSMQNVKAGGIDMILIISPEEDFFFFDSSENVDASDNGTIDASGGFGSTLDADGGALSRALAISTHRLFIPIGSDSLITSDGLTFKVL